MALAGVCVVAAGLFTVYWTPYGADDPWITYRFAENIAAGRGFVYNPGERVLGTTTPLYALLLACVKLMGLPVPETSWAISFVSMIAAIVLLFLLVRRLHGELAGVLAAGLLASAHQFHRVATFGMETSLYLALIVGAFLAYVSGRELLAAFLAACCLLIRPDGAAVGASLAVVHVLTHRQLPWKAALVYLAVIAPWALFSLSYFGTLVPNTIAAKRLHTQHTVLAWMPSWLLREPRTFFAVIGLGVALWSPSSRAGAAVLALWATTYAAAFSLGAVHGYDWYYTPLLPALAAGAGIATASIASWVAPRPVVRIAIAVALAAALVLPDTARAWRRVGGDEGILGVERLRYEAALWMRDSLPADAPIATGGIGLVGYYTGRHIYDAMGLVTPGAMRIEEEISDPHNVPFPRFLPAIIADYQPEYVFDGFWLPEGRQMPAFMEGHYEVVREWRGRAPSWPAFILYRRIPASAADSGTTP